MSDQPWRTQPEIDQKRQDELKLRLAKVKVPDIKEGNYPFKGMKLNRADVEWLLAMREDGRGPVNWDDKGLDLRGVDLRHEDLSGLPLARMRGGLILKDWDTATTEHGAWQKCTWREST